MNPYEPLESINIPLSNEWMSSILSLQTKIVVFPLVPTLVPNRNYIINLQVDGVTKISYVATHRISTFYSVLSTYNQSYSILTQSVYKSYTAISILNEMIKQIKSNENIDKIKDTYQLSTFQIQDELDIAKVNDIENSQKGK